MKVPAEFTNPSTVAAMTAASAGSDYKAIIRIFLYGGADSHNMLVPTASNPNRAAYAAARGALAVGSAATPLHLLSGHGEDATPMWRLHPLMDRIHALWSAGNVAIVRHVGTLDQPITKADYVADKKVAPDQIFAHNVQQDLWQASEYPDVPRTSGIFGRLAELCDPYYNNGTMSSFSTSGSARETTGFGRVSSDVGSTGPVLMDQDALESGPGRVTNQSRVKTLAGIINRIDAPRNVFYHLARNTLTSSYNSQVALKELILPASAAVESTFTDMPSAGSPSSTNPIRDQCRMALRVINARSALNQRRQTIFIGWGGWDHHSNLVVLHERLLEHLDNAIGALWDALVLLGLENSVTIQVESEFGRTLVGNGTAGVDHAWAGHGFTIGGAVRGGLYGPMPNYTINGPEDTGQGRFIPNVSTEQYHAPLMRWYGVPEALMPLVLRNSGAFPGLYAYDFMD